MYIHHKKIFYVHLLGKFKLDDGEGEYYRAGETLPLKFFEFDILSAQLFFS